MNRDEHILRRLLKAAEQPRRETPVSAMPFPLEARILAGLALFRAAKKIGRA